MKYIQKTVLVIAVLLCHKAFTQINVEQYTLSNGLTVILNEDHEKPEIFGGVVVKAGAKDDPADATGMAHYMEHMLFKGTESLGTTNWEKEKPLIDSIFMLYDKLALQTEQTGRDSIQKLINEVSVRAANYAIPNEMDALLRSIGSTQINAGTGPDQTMYYNLFPPTQIEKWLEIYTHRFEKPVFRSFQSELEVVYEEKNRANDGFFRPMFEEFNKNFFKNHPYGQQSTIGTAEDLKNPSLSKMKKFFDDWYAPNNMALVLVGNFDSEKVKPLIEKSFGRLEYKEVPEHKTYAEEPFNGREFVEVKMSPVKLGLLGYRSVNEIHEDKVALDVCNYMLANSGQSGLLDKLALDNKVLVAQLQNAPYQDHGMSILIIVPKIVGQKLDEAEEIVLEEIKKIHSGEFDDALLNIAKLDIYKDQMLSLEKNEWRGYMLADAWSNGQTAEEALKYSDKVMKVTKEDVMRVANKYYGDNYLAFHSKMGFNTPDKIEKPGFKPLVVNTDSKSEFAKKFEEIESVEPKPRFVDFEKDIEKATLSNGSQLYKSTNPQNDICRLTLRYGVGNTEFPVLNQLSSIMYFAGAGTYTVDSLKYILSNLGYSISTWTDNSYFYYELEGIEKNFDEAIVLFNELINNPRIEESKLEVLIEEDNANRKVEKSEVDVKAEALYEYALYSNQSEYINRLGEKEVKALTVSDLTAMANKVVANEMEAFYSGQKSAGELAAVLNEEMSLHPSPKKSASPVYLKSSEHTKNKIYFIDVKKASQCKIMFYINGNEFEKEEVPVYNAFNFYFSGSFSGLVLQEIREYRSLAYSASANYRMPEREGEKSRFSGYIGTQADKTIEAVETFNGLVREMPEKEERIDNIKNFLYQQSLCSRPDFRALPKTYAGWQQKGYTSDPNEKLAQDYKEIEFTDIVEFEAGHLKEKPMVICIAGDKKRVDLEELAKYGEITFVKDKDIFK